MHSPQRKHIDFVWHTAIPASLLAIVTVAAYWKSMHYDFQFDDIANIQKHFDIRHYSLSGLFFSGSRWMSYWLNSLYYKIGRFDPFAYRIGNLLIHTLNGLLIFFLTRSALIRSKKESFFSEHALGIALVTGLLFLLHPVQTQTVSYVIQGQLEGLATLFILCMLYVYSERAHSTDAATQWVLTAALLGLAAFSCGTKEIAIISPLLIALFDWFFISQGDVRSFTSRLWLLALLSLTIVGWYIYFLKPAFFTDILGFKIIAKNNIGNVITHNPQDTITPWIFFISQFKVIIHYLWIFLWPFNISVEYDWMLVKGFFSLDCLVPLAALLAIAFFIIQALRRNPTNTLCFGALWFFICIAPRSSIIPSPELLVDYKTYMASYGWLFILATAIIAGAQWLIPLLSSISFMRQQHHAFIAIALLLALPLGFFTQRRNTIWSSGKDFWWNIIEMAPGKARAYNNYGVELSQQFKMYAESIPYFEKAIAMDNKYPDPCNNLAVAHSYLGNTDAAIEALKRGLQINPHYPEGYNNLASFFLQKKMYDQAEKVLQHALKLRPYYGKAFFNLGRVYLETQQLEKAWECFRDACTKGDLDNALGFSTFAKISLSMQKYQDAIFAYKRTLELEPGDHESLFNLGNSYFFVADYEQAIASFKKAGALNPNDVRIWYNLGESYFKAENIAASLETFERIRAHNAQMPQMNLRIANCYDKLNNPRKAQEALQEIFAMNQATVPENIRSLANDYLAQIQQRAKMVASVTS